MRHPSPHPAAPTAWRGLIPLLALVLIPLVMCGQATTVVRQAGAGGTGGGPGNGPGSVKWSTCTTGDCQVYEHLASAALDAGGSATAIASCPADQRMLSGGYVIEHASGDMRVAESYPSGANTWTVTANNNTGTAATLDADINCVRVDLASAQTVVPAPTSVIVPAGAGATTTVVACPAGLVPTGGGFRLAPAGSASVGGARFLAGALPGVALSGAPSAAILASQPEAGGWQVAAASLYTPFTASAYAVCWNAQHWSTISADGSVPAGASAQADAGFERCPTGTTLTGGGFTIADPAAFGLLLVQRSGDNIDGTVLSDWTAAASNIDTSAAHSLSAAGICAV
jgi:hypothetical protein